jgi:hypothetical protein
LILTVLYDFDLNCFDKKASTTIQSLDVGSEPLPIH